MSGTSVFGIALSGLSAARIGIATVSHNISNVNTANFSKQEVIQGPSDAQPFGNGFIGQGVSIRDIRRAYSDFATAQLNESISNAGYFEGYSSQISKVDTLFGDQNAGLSSAVTDFFSSVQDMSTNPNDGSSRQNVVSTAEALSSRFNSLDSQLTDLRSATNNRIDISVTSVNQITAQIGELNKQIIVSANSGVDKLAPNDLLDKRDGLIRDLAKEVQITQVRQDDGAVNVFLGNGQALVVKDRAFQITSQRDPSNPEDFQLGLKLNPGTPNEKLIQFAPSDLGTGSLAGYLNFREGPLTQYQNTLGLIAAQFTTKINEINKNGVDQTGAPGVDLFNANGSRTVNNLQNKGDGQLTVGVVDFAKVTGKDYELSIVGGQLSSRLLGSRSDFTPLTPTGPGTFMLDGAVSFSLSGNPQEGDKFVLMPTRDAARNIRLIEKDPARLAAAKTPNSPGDNSNLLDIADLQTKEVLYQADPGARGSSLLTAYNQLVSQIGNKTREVRLAGDARNSILDINAQSQQSISGVNLDEEASDLLKYQQAYQAAGRVISLSKELFDQVVNLMGR
jgi:flagellar hook-associated protein 1 FlgK